MERYFWNTYNKIRRQLEIYLQISCSQYTFNTAFKSPSWQMRFEVYRISTVILCIHFRAFLFQVELCKPAGVLPLQNLLGKHEEQIWKTLELTASSAILSLSRLCIFGCAKCQGKQMYTYKFSLNAGFNSKSKLQPLSVISVVSHRAFEIIRM